MHAVDLGQPSFGDDLMRVALVHDYLAVRGGAERVFEAIEEVVPGTKFALFATPNWGEVTTSFLQKIPQIEKIYPLLLPLMPRAIESLDLSEFDLVISSSWAVAKGVRTTPHQLHICYCHTPMRYAWDLYEEYLQQAGWKRIFMQALMPRIRRWDYNSASRVDFWIANSQNVAKRIESNYGIKPDAVIHPPVDTEAFLPGGERGDFYLTVSRLVPYKNVDLIARAFTHLSDCKLIVIGDGPEKGRIMRNCGENVHFLGFQDDIGGYMARAKAFIFAANEDFGITPVEAQSCGTPVIAYGKGGALESVVEGETGIFFEQQNETSIACAVRRFETLQFDAEKIRQHALHFGKRRFQKELTQFVDACLHSRGWSRNEIVAPFTQELS